MQNTEEIHELQLFDLNRNEEKEKKPWKRKALYAVGGAVLAVYLLGAVYYTNRFFTPDTVFGVSMKGESVDSLKAKIVEAVKNYSLDIQTRSGEEVVTAQEIQMQFVDNGIVEELLKEQSPFLWPSIFFQKEGGADEKITVSYDQDLLKKRLAKSTFYRYSKLNKPKDAYVAYGKGQFEIVPEDNGKQIDEEQAIGAIEAAMQNGDSKLDLEDTDCYVTADITSENEGLMQKRDAMNQLLTASITYDFGDRIEVVDADVIQGWVVENEDGTYSLSKDAAEQYVADLADRYDTKGRNRDFRTFYGKTVVLTKGDYGWEMDQEATLDELFDAVLAGETKETEPVYLHTANSRDANDLGDMFIEVSIADQEMWLHKDGEILVDTPIVTGCVARRTSTPAGGVWFIKYKQSPATLGTIERNGYSTPVKYWMPFNGGVGIHDADGWRSSYGGNIYKYSGSHGCVNTPTKNVKIIYETVQKGTPVVVY